MSSLNYTLERAIVAADGCYLDPQALSSIEQYVQSYAPRLQTYQQLRDHSEKFVIHTLRHLSQRHPDLIQQHGQRCKYDLTEVLRYIALAILRDDEVFFTEQMMTWLDTILLAYKQTARCVFAYQYLQDAIVASLPESQANLIRPYLSRMIQALQAHA
jgi:hypothetical protein